MSKPKVGDWVRFRREGLLVIGVVEYVKPSNYSMYEWTVITSCGEIPETSILESRPAAAPEKEEPSR